MIKEVMFRQLLVQLRYGQLLDLHAIEYSGVIVHIDTNLFIFEANLVVGTSIHSWHV